MPSRLCNVDEDMMGMGRYLPQNRIHEKIKETYRCDEKKFFISQSRLRFIRLPIGADVFLFHLLHVDHPQSSLRGWYSIDSVHYKFKTMRSILHPARVQQ